jgi:hypothetical protein
LTTFHSGHFLGENNHCASDGQKRGKFSQKPFAVFSPNAARLEPLTLR